jgi:N4-gp56 family major capsid protein
VFYALADKKRLPKNSGQLYQFYRYDNIATSGLTGAINEGTLTANQSQLSAQVVTMTSNVYGSFVTLSRYAADTTRSGQLVEDAVDVLSDAISDVVDLLCKASLSSNSTAYYGTNLTATTASIVTSDLMTAATIRKAVRNLQAGKVRPFTDGSKYAAVIHPNQWYDLSSDTTVGGFLATAQYNQPEKIWKGEMGSLAGARLIMSQNLGTFTSAQITSTVTSVAYESYIVGQGAMATVSLEDSPVQILVKKEGGSSDPYSNIMTVAAKLNGFGVAYTGTDATSKRSYKLVTATTV